MKSAREIACTWEMGDCGGGDASLTNATHSAECDARTEAIQQAREDGARWALVRCERNHVAACDPVDPADVRKEAP